MPNPLRDVALFVVLAALSTACGNSQSYRSSPPLPPIEVSTPSLSAEQRAASQAMALRRARGCDDVARALANIDAEQMLSGPYRPSRGQLLILRHTDTQMAAPFLAPRRDDAWQPPTSAEKSSSIALWPFAGVSQTVVADRPYGIDGSSIVLESEETGAQQTDKVSIWTAPYSLVGSWLGSFTRDHHYLVLVNVERTSYKPGRPWWQTFRSRIDLLRLESPTHARQVAHVETPGRITWADVRDGHLLFASSTPIEGRLRKLSANEKRKLSTEKEKRLTYEQRAERRKAWLDTYWGENADEYRQLTLPVLQSRRSGKLQHERLGCKDIALPGPSTAPLRVKHASLLILNAIDLRTGRSTSRQGFLGGNWKLVSWGSSLLAAWASDPYTSDADETYLHLFDTSTPSGGVDYRARGTVDGLLLGNESMHALNRDAYLLGLRQLGPPRGDPWRAPGKTVVQTVARQGEVLACIDREEIRPAPRSYHARTAVVGLEKGLVFALPFHDEQVAVADASDPGKLQRLRPVNENDPVVFARANTPNTWFTVTRSSTPGPATIVTLYSNADDEVPRRIRRARCALELHTNYNEPATATYDPRTNHLRLHHPKGGQVLLHIAADGITKASGPGTCKFSD
ncbi:hypothetical protein FIV42_04140 [Persicimonas caeni]|uniref:Uncharacterized protein n=1 Tax=Persicimonas caeni TaxID=2292766 RepID=A0A4Y6PNR0_PERCE|nr:hypothetical protein [Persicimonas caeni]QDG49956.1 hypothetical protein FIV42_04140 [Persicimonas caeni]QED31177.1 hypothetical protein FRD00_04135 [Persicimonas caeni]